MTMLITGGNGFVLSNFALFWLSARPAETAIILDRNEPDREVSAFLAPVFDGVTWATCDVAEQGWHSSFSGVERIVHGAALTPDPWTDDIGQEHDLERSHPRAVFDSNLQGTLSVLDFARGLAGLRQIIVIGSASVYHAAGDGRPCAENAPISPLSLYGISKSAAELAALRYREIFDLPVVVARLAAVFGPMDRPLPSRHVICAPNRAVSLALAGKTLAPDDCDGVGDWVYVRDVARALAALADAHSPRHGLYNIASGQATTLAELCQTVTGLVPASSWAAHATPNILTDEGRRRGLWGGYDCTRFSTEFGWAPMPLKAALLDYIAWRSSFDAPAIARSPTQHLLERNDDVDVAR